MIVSRIDARGGFAFLVSCCLQAGACAPATPSAAPRDHARPAAAGIAAPTIQQCPADDLDCWLGDEDEVAAARERAFEREQNDETRDQLAAQHEQTMDALGELKPESIAPADWWCMQGTFEGEAVGGCRHRSEECVDLVVKAAARGVVGAAACERPAVVWCYGSARTVDEKRISRCFPAAEVCDRDRQRIAARDAWRDVSACAEIR